MTPLERAPAEFEAYVDENASVGTHATNSKQRYITSPKLKHYWKSSRIKDASGITTSVRADVAYIQDHFILVFSILTLIRCPTFIESFTHHLHLADEHLPFYSREPPEQWPRGVSFDLFCKAQWQFCPQELTRKRLMSGPHLGNEMILPFKKGEELRSGDSTTTYQILLDPAFKDQLYDENYPSGTNPDATDFVLKTYFVGDGNDAKKHYDTETEAFKHLMEMRDGKSVQSVVTFYGSWIQKGTYNVLLEYASCGDLAQYWKEREPPSRKEDIIMFWSRLLDVTETLVRLHEFWGECALVQGIHQDIKPTNILVFSNPGAKNEYDVVFKLADFDLSHFKNKLQSGQYVLARDKFGASMYCAPECCRIEGLQQSHIMITPKIDIWSYGCVLSEAATWVVLGTHGVEEYEQLRKKEIEEKHWHIIQQGYGDCFHDSWELLDSVKEMHRRLLQEHRKSDLITEDLHQLLSMIFPTRAEERLNAQDLYKLAKRILGKAEDGKHHTPFRTFKGPPVYRPSPSTGHAKGFLNDIQETSISQHPLSVTSTAVPTGSWNNQSMTPKSSPKSPARNMEYDRRRSIEVVPSMSPSGAGSSKSLFRRSTASRGVSFALQENDNLTRVSQIKTGISRNSPYVALATPLSQSRHFQHAETVSAHSTSPSVPNYTDRPSHNALGISQPPTPNQNRWPRQPAWGTDFSNLHTEPESYVQDYSRQNEHIEPLPHGHANGLNHNSITVKDALDWKKGSNYRIDNLLGKIADRDHAFLIDDSASMWNHWEQLIRTVQGILNIVKDADPDGVDIFFSNSNKYQKLPSRKCGDIVSILNKKRPTGECNMKEDLMKVIRKYINDNFEGRVESSRFRKVIKKLAAESEFKKRGLSVYVFTDAKWQEGPDPVCGVEEPIRAVVKKLQEISEIDTKVGIQFVQFGNDERGGKRLEILDSHLNRYFPDITWDIVDTTKCDGDIEKILLGAIDRHRDADNLQTPHRSLSYRSPDSAQNSQADHWHGPHG